MKPLPPDGVVCTQNQIFIDLIYTVTLIGLIDVSIMMPLMNT